MRLPHAIKPNEQCRTPKRVIAIRCEPRIERTSTGQVATFGEATIIEALQQWLDSRLDEDAPRNTVKSVKQSGNGYDTSFAVTLEETKPATSNG